jgi:NAD(P)-dependent dehydrogenase (short-subunit alcohol dehydrogenase family)
MICSMWWSITRFRGRWLHFEELGAGQIARNFETLGALEIIRAALPILRAQQSGHIVNISAAAVIANYAGFSIYGATKWPLEGVSESLAAELKPLRIKVTIVQPGPFRTDFIGRSLERAESHIADYDRTSGKFLRFLETMDGKQPGDPDKAAEAIIAAIESDAPRLRLVLGKYANDKVRRKLTTTETELTTWEPIGLSADYACTP